MQVRKEEVEQYQSINYFVREKLKAGEKLLDSELWAKEWLEQYVEKNKKQDGKNYYKAFHAIPKSVELWEERMNLNPSNPSKRKGPKNALDYKFKRKARTLLEEHRFKTLIAFESLQPEEYKIICDWFENDKELPEYLKGILKYQPTLKEQLTKTFSSKAVQFMEKSQNIFFYLFIGFFFIILMVINL